jgi:hypothetical protein
MVQQSKSTKKYAKLRRFASFFRERPLGEAPKIDTPAQMRTLKKRQD